MNGNDKGFVKLFRKIKYWEWKRNPNVVALFIHCIVEANIQDTHWQGQEIRRGEFVTSLNNLSLETGLTIPQVRNALKKLEDSGEVIAKSQQGRNYTIIRVCKFLEYQGQQSESKLIANQKQSESKVKAKREQSESKLIATDREYKEYKEDKEECVVGEADTPTRTISSSQSKPSLDDVKAFVSNKNLKVNPERFFYYYEARDWKDGRGQDITNWKMALMGWNAMPTHEEQVAGSDDGWLE